MAASSIPSCFKVLIFLLFHFKILSGDQSFSSFSKNFSKDPIFGSDIALYGDAKVVDGGSRIQLTDSESSSSGRVVYKKPIKFVEGKPMEFDSFSTYFSFSFSSENGEGLAFLLVPRGFNSSVSNNSSFGLSLGSKKRNFSFVAVEFDTSGNHVVVDLGSFESARVKNLSSVNLVLSNEVVHCWIDYEASSKRLEIRLNQSGEIKPVDPFLSYTINFSKMWNNEEVFMVLSSSNGNSSQTCFIYSWISKLWHVPNWMHSEPLDPESLDKKPKPLTVEKKNDCFLRVVAALILGTTCGALAASCVLYLRTIFGSRRPVLPEECAVHPVDFEYKKVKIVVDKAPENGK